MKTTIKLYVGILATATSLHVQAYPGENIMRDPATGNYTITYRGDTNSTELSQTVFIPSTKIVPTIRSSFRQGERGIIMYRYTVSNGAAAKQALVGVFIEDVVNPIIGELPLPSVFKNATQAEYDAYHTATRVALTTPTGWYGGIHRINSDNLNRIAWSPKPPIVKGGIPAGHTLLGFGFNSLDLPGMGSSRMRGIDGKDEMGGVLSFPDDGPVNDSAILAQLNQLRDNDFIVCNAAVPIISVPVPYDAAVLIERIRSHISTWSGKQLADSAFVAQLDRYLVAAADAYRLNNTKAGRENIETLRKMLEHEHKYLDHDDEDKDDAEERKVATRFTIDRLAARVLDFDLRYVLKRMEREHEGNEGKKGRN